MPTKRDPVTAQVKRVISQAEKAATAEKKRRKSGYSPEMAHKMCELLSEGVPLREICRMPGMPAWRNVYYWMSLDPELAAHIAKARAVGYDSIAEECLDIADNATNDWVEREQYNPRTKQTEKVQVLNAEHIQRSKLRIETRLKLLAKWSNKYSDRHVITGDEDGAPIRIEGNSDHQRLLELIKAMEMRRRVPDEAE